MGQDCKLTITVLRGPSWSSTCHECLSYCLHLGYLSMSAVGCQLLGTHSYHLLKRAALGQWEPACLEDLEECAHPQEGP